MTTTVRQPGATARLKPTFDGAALAAELDQVRRHAWQRQRVYGDQIGQASKVDWTCLALRSPGGDGDRTDPGGPGPVDFADTPWLERTPQAREVLRSIPAPLRAVRYMALGPGTHSHLHFDTKYGPSWGVARLHVPITTNPDALLHLDGEEHCWQPGEFWFGDFSRNHQVGNDGTEPRVHLVIDCLVVPELAEIFPDSWREFLLEGGAVLNRPATPLPGSPKEWECAFEVPETFTDWEEEDGAFLDPAVPRRRATVHAEEDHLLLTYEGAAPVRLIHLEDGEFRYAGWSEERTVQLHCAGGEVVLRSRVGSTVRTLTLPMLHHLR
ncbi:aspartyl/asparaginyl beta-hydroxylase domain-containing protein [Streptomyces cyanogenus]|uniref:Aspartyl/Asparaginyl beta-hydroxylase n=1 Tax=Streptomyces cyanogenus TaxID=80860 RepID=A0ABX7TSJ1_STRCY|nr:aspartyl/asparaginyl beta-hydroxylase domain-containing protein [Streptomyces cyanogenus]QTD99714.1 Aspartyl/Asparaginyl beta-hydroxylase [Streptomyces cyanogenus]